MAGPFYSDQITNLDKTPPVLPDADVSYGKLRTAVFRYVTAALAVGEIVYLCEIPANARVLALYINAEALSSAGGTAGADFGDDGDADRYATAVDLDAATNKFIPLRLEVAGLGAKTLGMGFKTGNSAGVAKRLRATATGEAWTASKELEGFVLYSVE